MNLRYLDPIAVILVVTIVAVLGTTAFVAYKDITVNKACKNLGWRKGTITGLEGYCITRINGTDKVEKLSELQKE